MSAIKVGVGFIRPVFFLDVIASDCRERGNPILKPMTGVSAVYTNVGAYCIRLSNLYKRPSQVEEIYFFPSAHLLPLRGGRIKVGVSN